MTNPEVRDRDVTVVSGIRGDTAEAGARELAVALARRRRRRRAWIWSARLAVLVIILGAWQLCSGRVFPSFVVSSPSAVGTRLWQWLQNGYLESNLGVTLEETAIGFLGGSIVGAAAGILLGMNRGVADVAAPYINAFYALPKIMLGPLLVVWFGIELEMKAVLSGLFVVFIVFYNIWSGVREVDSDLLDMFRILEAKPWAIIKNLYIPSAITWFFTSLRIAFPVALIGSIVGEFIASNEGIGYVATKAASLYDSAGVFAGIIVITVAAVVVDGLIVFIQRLVTRRHGGEGVRLVL